MMQGLEKAHACEAKSNCHSSDVIFHKWRTGVTEFYLCTLTSITSIKLYQTFMHSFVKLRKLLKTEIQLRLLEHADMQFKLCPYNSILDNVEIPVKKYITH